MYHLNHPLKDYEIHISILKNKQIQEFRAFSFALTKANPNRRQLRYCSSFYDLKVMVEVQADLDKTVLLESWILRDIAEVYQIAEHFDRYPTFFWIIFFTF